MTTNQRPTKTERQAAAQAAAARAAQRKRRIQAVAGALTGLTVFALLMTAVIVFRDDDGDGTASPALTTTPVVPSQEPTAAPSPTAQAAAAQFPPVPEGADPALREKPRVTAGQGAVTKLVVTPLIEGKGAAAAQGQTITVNYVGVTYGDGKEFDSSWTRQEAAQFEIGVGRVIPGWDQGLVGVKVGSRVQLDIPANLAYGDSPQPGYPAGALRFVVDLLAVQ